MGRKKTRSTTTKAPSANATTNTASSTTNTPDGMSVHKWVKAIDSGSMGEFAVDVYDKANIVRKWNGAHWELVEDEDGIATTLAWMHKNYKKGCKGQAASYWATSASLYRLKKAVPQRDTSEVVVAMRNCYLTVGTNGVITTATPNPKKGMRFSIPTNFKGAVGAPYTPRSIPPQSLFGTYLDTSMPDPKMRALVQEMVAMTLVDNRQQKVLWNYGDGMNGKGVLTELISKVHPKICTMDLHKLDGNHALEGIPNASLLITDECGKGKWQEDVFKAIVSGDPLNINPKNRAAYTHRNTSCWILNTNPPPFFTDISFAVRRRIIPVPWTAQMTAETKVENLAKLIIASEFHLVMDWLLEGLVRLAKRNFKEMPLSDYPQTVLDAKDQMSVRGDSLEDWLKSNEITCVEHAWLSKEVVYQHYVLHCADVDTKPLEPNAFWKALPQKPSMQMVTKQKRKGVGADRVRYVQVCLSKREAIQAQAHNTAVDLLPDVPIDDMRFRGGSADGQRRFASVADTQESVSSARSH